MWIAAVERKLAFSNLDLSPYKNLILQDDWAYIFTGMITSRESSKHHSKIAGPNPRTLSRFGDVECQRVGS